MIDFTKMTHLLLAFGTVSGTNDWSMGAADSDVQTLAAAAHAANVKVLVSIGGADADIGIINAYGSASNIAPLVSNLDAMISRLNLDGVDVDLERGSMMMSSSNYPAFVSQLLSTFHPEGKLVTTALAQYIVQDANPDPTITATVQSFDFINDMIYSTNMSDYTNEASWWTSTIQLPNDKLVWGVQFTNNLSVGTATQIAMASKAYGGVMCWEYTQPTESQLWPAIQSVF
jgi:chitinase